jgi:hypothetical protein
MVSVAIIILVLIFAIVALYYVAVIFNPEYLVRDPTTLKGVSTISAKELDSAGASRYYYGGWFYIENNTPPDKDNILFNRGKDFICALKGSTLKVYVNNTDNAAASITDGIVTGASNEIISVSNVPFQKWAHIVLHVDGPQIDAYVDGKLAQSNKHNTIINSTATTDITFGNKYTEGRLTRFKRPAANINAQGVYSDYMLGSGQGSVMGGLGKHHVNVQVTKNDTVKVNQRIF